jgi:glycosyltransferase involved in cell wall biosynthesis
LSLRNSLQDFDQKLEFEVILVNDGSTDETSVKILEFAWDKLTLIELMSNSGQMYAIEAGLNFATGDLIVTMDGDQQHPPTHIQKMYELQLSTKCDVVIGVRKRGKEASLATRKASSIFYRILSKFTDFNVVNDGGEFRLMTQEVVQHLINLSESQKVYRFLISELGFKAEFMEFQTPPRPFGKSKYSLRSRWKLGITSLIGFSTAPLTLIFLCGLFIFMFSIFYLIFLLANYFLNKPLPGWTSITFLVVSMSSIQIMALGVIGRYLSQLMLETRRRPRYLVRRVMRIGPDGKAQRSFPKNSD